MTIMARLARVLLALSGTLLITAGAALLWEDAQLDRSAPLQADIVLSGPRVTDLDLPVDDRVRHLQCPRWPSLRHRPERSFPEADPRGAPSRTPGMTGEQPAL